MKRLAFSALGLTLLSANAWAQKPTVSEKDANDTLARIAAEVTSMQGDLSDVRSGYDISIAPEVGRMDRRLREAEIHFLLNDFLRAAIVLLDVVDEPASKAHPRYGDALFMIGKSLQESRNYVGAQRYYEELLPRTSGEQLKDTVLGLLQISSATDNYENVERYIARLREAGGLKRPDVDYIYGKMLFSYGLREQAQMTRAVDVFKGITANSEVGPKAAYFAGVSLVQLGRYDEAVAQFRETHRRLGADATKTRLHELTYLSLGRLFQEMGKVEESTDAYQEIPQSSPYFSEMLFELAWAHVTRANQHDAPEDRDQALERALQATELLMATAPSSNLMPQARILQGNLQIRLGAPETAYDTFQVIVDRFGGARDKVLSMMNRAGDAKRFFRELVSSDLDEIEAQGVLPPLAVSWAMEVNDMERAVGLHRGLSESDSDMAEAKELVETLEAALYGEQRFNIFPGLKEPRATAIAVENRILVLRQQLLQLERSILMPVLVDTDRARLATRSARGLELEERIREIPEDRAGVESSDERLKNAYQASGRRASQMGYRIQGMRAQIVAVERWLRDNRAEMAAHQVDLMEERLTLAREEVTRLAQELGVLQADLRRGEVLAASGGGAGSFARLADEYAGLMQQEMTVLRSRRSSAPAMRGVFDRIDGSRLQLDALARDLGTIQQALDAKVANKVNGLRLEIAQEANNIEKYSQEHRALSGESNEMLGPVSERTLAAVGKQFHDLVLKADVGIIDVAWARKRIETDKVNGLIREQQRRTRELESEFAEVLSDE